MAASSARRGLGLLAYPQDCQEVEIALQADHVGETGCFLLNGPGIAQGKPSSSVGVILELSSLSLLSATTSSLIKTPAPETPPSYTRTPTLQPSTPTWPPPWGKPLLPSEILAPQETKLKLLKAIDHHKVMRLMYSVDWSLPFLFPLRA